MKKCPECDGQKKVLRNEIKEICKVCGGSGEYPRGKKRKSESQSKTPINESELLRNMKRCKEQALVSFGMGL